MENTVDVQPESSPAFEVPRDGAAYAEWRQTGKLPEAKPAQPKGESAPPKESSAEGQQPKEKAAPVSETGKQDQERQKPPRDNAATRLTEILEDLKKAGLTPAELKNFKREAQKATEQIEQPKAEAKAAPETTENPTELKPPTKPKQEDFKTYEEFEAAKDKYFEDMADYKAAKKFQEFQFEQARNAAYQRVQQKLNEAATKYADDPAAVETIQATSRALVSDQQIPLAVKAMIDQSDVWPDIVYTLGKPEELQALAKENPGAAIRKVVLIEHLITQELGKGSKSPQADESKVTPIRDESGKFQKTTPEKEESDAPPPPREVSGRGATPPDEVAAAVKNNDFRRFKDSQNAKDMSRNRRR